MRLIDADKFLGYLIFSKHIDSLKCKEVKEAVKMCEVNVLEQIRDEIKHLLNRPSLTHVVGYDKGFVDGIDKVLQIID